jgi:hypothetical protein
MPLNLKNTGSLLRTLIRASELLLKQYGDELSALYRLGLGEGDMGDLASDAEKFVLSPAAIKPVTATQIIEYIHKMSGDYFAGSDTFDEKASPGSESRTGAAAKLTPPSPGALVRASLGELRQELLQIYFYIADDELLEKVNQDADLAAPSNAPQPMGQTVREAASCITRFFEVLFPTPELRGRFFALLGSRLTHNEIESMPVPSMSAAANRQGKAEKVSLALDYCRSLRLFSRVCFKYRGNSEVVKLFHASHYHGLVVFQQLLSVYSCLSRKAMEDRLLQQQG